MSPLLKLLFGVGIVAGATGYLAWLGAASSWQYYVLVDECTRSPDSFVDQRLRVSGHVAPASLKISPDRASATFILRGETSDLQVACEGRLPDNLAEDMDVVVEGTLNRAGALTGDKVITRCASKYEAARGAAQTAATISGDAPRR